MGIQGLLPLLKSVTSEVHIKDYANLRVAIDGYCWLHRAVFSCSYELCMGIPTEKYIAYVCRKLRFLLDHGVIPILVFDGDRLPAKKGTEHERQKNRKMHMEAALKLVGSDMPKAVDHFQKAVDVTPLMAKRVIDAARSMSVECVVAPYEADAQLAFLALNNLVDVVFTEDSDLLAYGCPRVFFKMDKNGFGREVRFERLGGVEEPGVRFSNWTHDMFTEFCILCGCDFLPSPTGLGPKTANKIMCRYKSFERAFPILKRDYGVTDEYAEMFVKAYRTFRYHRVFDIRTNSMAHLHPLPEDLAETDLSFIGPDIDAAVATKVANGDVDPSSHEPFALPPPSAAITRRFSPRRPPPQLPLQSGAAAAAGSLNVTTVGANMHGQQTGLVFAGRINKRLAASLVNQHSMHKFINVSASAAASKPFAAPRAQHSQHQGEPGQSAESPSRSQGPPNADVNDILRMYDLKPADAAPAVPRVHIVSQYFAAHASVHSPPTSTMPVVAPATVEASRLRRVNTFLFGDDDGKPMPAVAAAASMSATLVMDSAERHAGVRAGAAVVVTRERDRDGDRDAQDDADNEGVEDVPGTHGADDDGSPDDLELVPAPSQARRGSMLGKRPRAVGSVVLRSAVARTRTAASALSSSSSTSSTGSAPLAGAALARVQSAASGAPGAAATMTGAGAVAAGGAAAFPSPLVAGGRISVRLDTSAAAASALGGQRDFFDRFRHKASVPASQGQASAAKRLAVSMSFSGTAQS